MASSSVSEAQMKSEIARLTATINQRKLMISGQPSSQPRTNSRNNTYVNPNYKPPSNKYIRPSSSTATRSTPTLPQPQVAQSTEVKDVVINGVAFESSGRSLVRKDLPKPATAPSIPKLPSQHQAPFTRKSGHLVPNSRTYKPKSRRGRPVNRNMTLNNTTRPYQSVNSKLFTVDHLTEHYLRSRVKRLKYSDKPCPRFTTTADTCALSHDPTPERTPLCLHFLNKGRCARDKCPFPHVNVGTRQGICRDFAVLGYCAKGLDCDKQHVRECPDFAENGTCGTKGCKLPHVIRANRNRKPSAKTPETSAVPTTGNVVISTDSSEEQQAVHPTADDARLGDEYISLTFNESESDEEESEEESDEDEDEEGSDPTGLASESE
ncbi:hypothetical protein H0H93_011761 [Arthromyces matolae]|nr:hypothetical protein H0H93_011761 [Arthromyces matolae]